AAERRALCEALGKVGGERSLALLSELDASEVELARLAERARLILTRNAARAEVATIRLEHALPRAERVWLRCRPGLGEILADEARVLIESEQIQIEDDGVRLRHAGTFGDLLRLRTALDCGIELPIDDDPQASAETRIVRALGSDAALATLQA